MKPRANLAPRLAFGLCGLGGFVWLEHGARADRCTPTPAASWSAANLPGTPHIRIDYIGGGSWPPTSPTGDDDTSDTQGLGALARDRRRGERAEFPRRRLLYATCRRTASSPSRNGRPPPTARGRSMPRRAPAVPAWVRRAGAGRRRHAEAARHALRRRLAGRQCPGRPQLPRHQPGADSTALLPADQPDAGARHRVARTRRPADRRRRRSARAL